MGYKCIYICIYDPPNVNYHSFIVNCYELWILGSNFTIVYWTYFQINN